MQCPDDKTGLVMSERSGVEIDYCPRCRGVWLQRGELDKIIERSAFEPGTAPAEREYGAGHHGAKRKKRGFLGDLFDF